MPKTGVQPPVLERIKVGVGCFDALIGDISSRTVMLGASVGQLWGSSSGDSGTFLPLFLAACSLADCFELSSVCDGRLTLRAALTRSKGSERRCHLE